MTSPWEVAVVSSDLENRQSVARMLSQRGVDHVCASTVDQCREIFDEENIGLVFCDGQLSDGDFRDILTVVACSVKKIAKVVVMSALMTSEEYHEVRHCGVFDIIPVPCRPSDIEWMVVLARRDERIRAKQLGEVPGDIGPLRKVKSAGIS